MEYNSKTVLYGVNFFITFTLGVIPALFLLILGMTVLALGVSWLLRGQFFDGLTFVLIWLAALAGSGGLFMAALNIKTVATATMLLAGIVAYLTFFHGIVFSIDWLTLDLLSTSTLLFMPLPIGLLHLIHIAWSEFSRKL